MVKLSRIALAFLCVTFAFTAFSFQFNENETSILAEEKDPITISLVAEDDAILPGHPFWVAIDIKLDPSWHVYWLNPGDSGMAPVITWNMPDGFSTGEILWPTPKRFDVFSVVGFGYEDSFTLLAEILPPQTYTQTSAELGADIRWLVCSDSSCLPGESTVKTKLAMTDSHPIPNGDHASLFTQARARLPLKKNEVSAKRKNGFIELSFSENSPLKKAEFYPETKNSIDQSAPAILEAASNSNNQHSLALKESNPSHALKGILVLETANGTQAYGIDLPIDDSLANSSIVMNATKSKALSTEEPIVPSELADISFDFQGGVALAIVLAFIGGLLLNLMPCVLPVISLKIMSFIKLSGKSRALVLQHGLAFTAGVLISFWVLAALLLSLQAYGSSVGWGFQLQEPIFVATLAALIFAFSLSLFGVFEMGTSLISAGGNGQLNQDRNALVGSFFSGILATAVATPCTGPFLGSAVGFAVTLPPIQAMLIFTALGLGMASPYLLFAAFPALMRYMPKPGPWMITFKEVMGFFMLATVLWLLWVFSAQTSTLAVSSLLASFFILAIGCWTYGKWGSPMKRRTTRLVGTSVAIAFCALSGYLLVWASTSLEQETSYTLQSGASTRGEIADGDVWEEFSPERVAELRAQGIPVFIDFTAKWCLICQANHMVLSLDQVTKDFNAKGVVKMKADWTKRDAVITKELKKFGRNSVPLYVLYDGDEHSAPQILPQVLTPDIIVSSIDNLEAIQSIAEK